MLSEGVYEIKPYHNDRYALFLISTLTFCWQYSFCSKALIPHALNYILTFVSFIHLKI